MDAVDRVLAHHGVKGMRWGVRKDRSGSSSSGPPEPVTLRTQAGKKIQTSGGGGHGPSEDAKNAAAYQQKAKSSGTHSLTNEQLKVLVDRLSLEQRYSKILSETNQKSGTRKFVDGLIQQELNSALKGKQGPVTAAIGAAMALGSHKGTGKHRKA